MCLMTKRLANIIIRTTGPVSRSAENAHTLNRKFSKTDPLCLHD